MAPPRHGRAATIGSAALVVLLLVVLATVGVAIFAGSVLAIRLAVAGALAAGAFVWSAYDATLREARVEVSRERASAARASTELALERSSHVRAAATIEALEKELGMLRSETHERPLSAPPPSAASGRVSGELPDLWTDNDETPTVVDLSGRRVGRSSPDDAYEEAVGDDHRPAARRARSPR